MTGSVPDRTPAATSHRAGGVLTTLQAGRAFAALAVVFYHANLSATNLVGGAPRFAPILSYGALGVDFFFVLSGFIIYHSSVGYRPDRHWVGGFLIRRAIRIYLPYWPVGVGLALLCTVLPGFGSSGQQFSWLSSLTLLPTDRLPALIPAWTLQHEVFFYAIFALLVWLRRLWIGLAAWTIVLALLWWPNGPESNVALASMNIEFVAGIVAAHFVLHDRVPQLVFAILGGMFIIAYFIGGPTTNSVVFGLGVAFFVACATSLERRGLINMPGIPVLLGNASYSIYLVHNPLLAVTTRIALHVGQSWWLAMVIGVVTSVTAGFVYYFVYEKFALRFAQRHLLMPRRKASPAKGEAMPEKNPPARSERP